jgi:hypothetical protein
VGRTHRAQREAAAEQPRRGGVAMIRAQHVVLYQRASRAERTQAVGRRRRRSSRGRGAASVLNGRSQDREKRTAAYAGATGAHDGVGGGGGGGGGGDALEARVGVDRVGPRAREQVAAR